MTGFLQSSKVLWGWKKHGNVKIAIGNRETRTRSVIENEFSIRTTRIGSERWKKVDHVTQSQNESTIRTTAKEEQRRKDSLFRKNKMANPHRRWNDIIVYNEYCSKRHPEQGDVGNWVDVGIEMASESELKWHREWFDIEETCGRREEILNGVPKSK